MDTLEIKGRKYIKVSALAKQSGYTADYIGQLARAKKIDAELVGRSWYVLDGALDEHKREKIRSNFKKTKEYAARAAEEYRKNEEKSPITPYLPAYRKHLMSHRVSYVADSDALLPRIESLPSEEVSVPETEALEEHPQQENEHYDAVLASKIEQEASETSEEPKDTSIEIEEAPSEELSGIPLSIGDSSKHNRSRVRAYEREVQSKESRKDAFTLKHANHNYPVRRSSLLPMLISTAVAVFVLAVTIFAQNSWEFETGNKSKGERAVFRSGYQISNLSSVIDAFSKLK